MIVTMKRIWQMCRNRRDALLTALSLSFLRSVLGLTEILAIIRAVEVFTVGADVQQSLLYVSVLTLICVIGNFIVSYFEQTNTMKAGFFAAADERIVLGNRLRKVPLGFFNQTSMGKITTVLTTSVSNIESGAPMVMVGIVSGFFNSLALFIFMMFYDWRIGLVMGLGMAVYLWIVSLQMKLSAKNAPRLQEAQNNLSKAALTYLQGIKVIKSYDYSRGDVGLKNAVAQSRTENVRLTDSSMPLQFSAGIVLQVFESALMLLAIVLYFFAEQNPLVKTVVVLIFSFMAYASLNQAGSMLSMIGLLNESFKDIEQVETGEEIAIRQPIGNPVGNEICLNNVCFSYGEREVLHDINLTVKPGTLTALIGPSGSGKTTLCQLIARFREVTQGSITLGGVDIRNIEYEQLMKRISMVFQNVYLFEDTVLNNIRFGVPQASEEQVRAAAKKARCDEFIRALPNGYNTVVTEGGGNLSGGEKQRISIARAILKDSPIVILDEATSALDPENEREIMSAIDELTNNKTVIMIAHRMQTVRRADWIVALNGGVVEEQGTHEELKNQSGIYSRFLSAREQSKDWKLKN